MPISINCFWFWLPANNVGVSKVALARTKLRGCINGILFGDDVLATHLTLNSSWELRLQLINFINFWIHLLFLLVLLVRHLDLVLFRFHLFYWFYYLRLGQNHALQTLIFFLKLDDFRGQIANCALLPDLEHFLKKSDLFLKFAHHFVISSVQVVALNSLHDVSGSVCKLECTHGLLDCVGRRANSGNQVCFCAPWKGVLE